MTSFTSARAAGRGAKQQRDHPFSRVRRPDLRVFLKKPSGRLCRLAEVLGILAFFFSPAQCATLPDASAGALSAIASIDEANYCFARVRGLDPGRLPPSYLVLQLRVKVVYRNIGTRPLILPLERERAIYTAVKPGPMTLFHTVLPLLEPAYKPMKFLPADVNPESPLMPANDVFKVIASGGEMATPLLEHIIVPVNRTSLFKKEPDLRGQTLYLRLKFFHRELSDALMADLSDRWARFGVPWTGTLMTNTFAIDIPAWPKAEPCNDSQSVAP